MNRETLQSRYLMALIEDHPDQAKAILKEGESMGLPAATLCADIVGETLAQAERRRKGDMSAVTYSQVRKMAIDSLSAIAVQDPSSSQKKKALVVALGEKAWPELLVSLLIAEGWRTHLEELKTTTDDLWKAIQSHKADLVVLHTGEKNQIGDVEDLLGRRPKPKKGSSGGPVWIVTGRGLTGQVARARVDDARAVVNPLRILSQVSRKPAARKSASSKKKQLREDPRVLKTVGDSIRRERKGRKMTQQELADLTGLKRPYIVLAESGQQNVTILQLTLIARALDVSLSVLVQGVR